MPDSPPETTRRPSGLHATARVPGASMRNGWARSTKNAFRGSSAPPASTGPPPPSAATSGRSRRTSVSARHRLSPRYGSPSAQAQRAHSARARWPEAREPSAPAGLARQPHAARPRGPARGGAQRELLRRHAAHVAQVERIALRAPVAADREGRSRRSTSLPGGRSKPSSMPSVTARGEIFSSRSLHDAPELVLSRARQLGQEPEPQPVRHALALEPGQPDEPPVVARERRAQRALVRERVGAGPAPPCRGAA